MDHASTAAAHEVGELIVDNAPFLWSNDRVEERHPFAQVTNQRVADSRADPVVARLQEWLDRFDAVTRVSVRAKTGGDLQAPKPRLMLVVNREVNASVWRRPTLFAGTPATRDEFLVDQVMDVHLFTPRRARGLSPFYPWATAPSTWDADSGVAWFNGLGGMTLRRSGARFEAVGQDATHAGRAVFVDAASPHVVVHTGLVQRMSERAAAAVLAHELGHYYRAHGSTGNPIDEPSGRYNYWYARDAPTPHRPAPAANQAAYNALFAEGRALAVTVPGQTLEPMVASRLIEWAERRPHAAERPCGDATSAAKQWPPDTAYRLRFGGGTDADRAHYASFEATIVACAGRLTLDDELRKNLAYEGERGFGEIWATAVVSSSTLAELLAEANAGAVALVRQMADIERRQAGNHLGFYTAEQEADEIALELLAAVGLDPKEAIEAELSKPEHPVPARPGEPAAPLGVAECRAAYARDFKNPDGSEVFVSLGPLADPHHSTCYRVYNMSREIAAHAYRVASPRFVDDAGRWAELQALARALEASPP